MFMYDSGDLFKIDKKASNKEVVKISLMYVHLFRVNTKTHCTATIACLHETGTFYCLCTELNENCRLSNTHNTQ